jgi:hypothetical protein
MTNQELDLFSLEAISIVPTSSIKDLEENLESMCVSRVKTAKCIENNVSFMNGVKASLYLISNPAAYKTYAWISDKKRVVVYAQFEKVSYLRIGSKPSIYCSYVWKSVDISRTPMADNRDPVFHLYVRLAKKHTVVSDSTQTVAGYIFWSKLIQHVLTNKHATPFVYYQEDDKPVRITVKNFSARSKLEPTSNKKWWVTDTVNTTNYLAIS